MNSMSLCAKYFLVVMLKFQQNVPTTKIAMSSLLTNYFVNNYLIIDKKHEIIDKAHKIDVCENFEC